MELLDDEGKILAEKVVSGAYWDLIRVYLCGKLNLTIIKYQDEIANWY